MKNLALISLALLAGCAANEDTSEAEGSSHGAIVFERGHPGGPNYYAQCVPELARGPGDELRCAVARAGLTEAACAGTHQKLDNPGLEQRLRGSVAELGGEALCTYSVPELSGEEGVACRSRAASDLSGLNEGWCYENDDPSAALCAYHDRAVVRFAGAQREDTDTHTFVQCYAPPPSEIDDPGHAPVVFERSTLSHGGDGSESGICLPSWATDDANRAHCTVARAGTSAAACAGVEQGAVDPALEATLRASAAERSEEAVCVFQLPELSGPDQIACETSEGPVTQAAGWCQPAELMRESCAPQRRPGLVRFVGPDESSQDYLTVVKCYAPE